MPRLHFLTLTLTLASLAKAQTFVVDAANGPGAHFADLVTAVATVPDGAVLDVRPGLYLGLAIQGKSLTVLGQPGARLLQVMAPAVSIAGLTAQQNVTVRGFQLEPLRVPGLVDIVCSNSLGGIVIDAVVPNWQMASQRKFAATNCDRVVVRGGAFSRTCEVTASHVVFVQCSIGSDGNGTPGLLANGGAVQVVGGSLYGAFGFGQAGAPAVMSNGADVRLLGSLTVAGGLGVGGPNGLAVGGTGTVRMDPSVVLQASTPPFAAGILATIAPQAMVTVDDPAVGTPVTARLHGPDGHLGVLALGFPGPTYTVPGIADRLFWEPLSAVTQVVGVPSAGQPLAGVVAVPNQAAWLGLQLVWHGLTWSPSDGLQVSNPGFHVVH